MLKALTTENPTLKKALIERDLEIEVVKDTERRDGMARRGVGSNVLLLMYAASRGDAPAG